MESYRASEDEVKKLKTAMGVDSINDAADAAIGAAGFDDHTAKITSAVSSLPELLEKKRVIDMHMNIATSVLDQIKSRKLDMFFESEEQIMGKQVRVCTTNTCWTCWFCRFLNNLICVL